MLCSAASSIAHSADLPPGMVEVPPGLFGDWGGLRTALADHGLDLQLAYINEFATNTQGGTSRESTYADQIYFGGSLDLRRLIGLEGSKIDFSFTDRNGKSLSIKAGLNTLHPVQEVYGHGDWGRLDQLYWEQRVGNHVVLKFGRITGTLDFMPFSCYFENDTFCATLPTHNVADNWLAFPVGTWAGIARFNFKDSWYLQAGVYEVNTDLSESKYRFAFGRPFGGAGTREVMEAGWLPSSAGPEGGYRIGAWYDDVGGNDLFLNTVGQPIAISGGTSLPRHHQIGSYAMAQQRVWSYHGSEARGISVFFNFVQGDRRTSELQQIAEVGFFWKGPTDWRPQDAIGVATGRVHANGLLAEGAELFNSELALPSDLPVRPVPGNENASEIHYSIHIAQAIVIRPNIQFIRAPGGNNEAESVVVLGLHLSIQF